MRITSLPELKKWNDNPTEEKPIVMEWLFPWFFDELLMKDKFKEARDAYFTYLRFTKICEKLTTDESLERVRVNLGWYADRGHKWVLKLKEFYEKENIDYRSSSSSSDTDSSL